jgi:hypothetical protein
MSECLGGILGNQSRSDSSDNYNAFSTSTSCDSCPNENNFPELTVEEFTSISIIQVLKNCIAVLMSQMLSFCMY